MAFVIQSVVDAAELVADAPAALPAPAFPDDEDHTSDALAMLAAAEAAAVLSAVFTGPVQVVASGDERRLSVSVSVLPPE